VRVELAQKSSSSSSSHAGESFATDASSSSSSSSFTTTTATSLVLDKLIVLIIDAARYDWVANSASHSALKREESDDESNKNHGLTELRDYYYNTAGAGAGAGATARKRKWRKEKSDDIDSDSDTSDSLLFKFIADAPTTTSQRLKGLLTGSLPTFVDVSNSFSSKNARGRQFDTSTSSEREEKDTVFGRRYVGRFIPTINQRRWQ
jgi:hypothetical protein